MDDLIEPPLRRTLTPAVLVSALFVVACAVIAITFVASRGGLQMPVAPTRPAVAVVSPGPSVAPTAAPTTAAPTLPAASQPTATGTPEPSGAPSAPPATPVPTPAGPPDPLAALPGCPDVPGCYQYLIRRDDSLSGVASRYAIPVRIVLALNPEITDPGTIVVGQVLYLGRSPFLRLPPCDGIPDCSLYTVKPGDRLSTIAGRFGITTASILAANDEISDPNAIRSGQVIRLPHPAS